jgi:hypothetical protein
MGFENGLKNGFDHTSDIRRTPIFCNDKMPHYPIAAFLPFSPIEPLK